MRCFAGFITGTFILGSGLGLLIGSRWGRDAAGPAAPVDDGGPVWAMPPRAGAVPSREAAEDRADDPIARAIASIPMEPFDRGRGRIDGTVMTDAGDPLEGVLVRALPTGGRRGPPRPAGAPGDPADESLERQVADLVADRKWELARRTEGATDASGSFSLEGLPEEDHDLRAYRKGYEIRPAGEPEIASIRARPGASIAFIARALHALRLSVLLPDGSQAPDADLEIQEAKGGSRDGYGSSWAPGDPLLWLPRGTWRLKAFRGDLSSDPVEIAVEEGPGDRDLTLQMKERSGIRGRIILPEGDVFKTLFLYILKWEAGDPPTAERLREIGEQSWAGDGRGYSYQDLVPGTYYLGVSYGQYGRIVVIERVEVGGGTVTKDIGLPAPDPRDCVLVRVFAPDGEAVEDVEFETGYLHPLGGGSGPAEVVRRRDGSFWILHRQGEGGDAGGRHSIEARSERYGRRRVEYIPSEAAEIRIDLAGTATLEVTIENLPGSGYEGFLRVGLEADRGSWSEGVEERRPLEPAFSIGPVEPGGYLLSFSIERERYLLLPFLTVPVDLAAGVSRKIVSLPPLHTLTVVFGPAAAKHVYIGPAAGVAAFGGRGKSPDEAGRVLFDRIPAGRYRIYVLGGPGREEMEVTVPSPGEVPFEAERVNSLVVTIEEGDGVLGACGLQTGDRIVAIDGVSFVSHAELLAATATARLKREVKLGVLRDGRKLEIAVDPEKLWGEGNRGGTLEPAGR